MLAFDAYFSEWQAGGAKIQLHFNLPLHSQKVPRNNDQKQSSTPCIWFNAPHPSRELSGLCSFLWSIPTEMFLKNSETPNISWLAKTYTIRIFLVSGWCPPVFPRPFYWPLWFFVKIWWTSFSINLIFKYKVYSGSFSLPRCLRPWGFQGQQHTSVSFWICLPSQGHTGFPSFIDYLVVRLFPPGKSHWSWCLLPLIWMKYASGPQADTSSTVISSDVGILDPRIHSSLRTLCIYFTFILGFSDCILVIYES